MVTMVTEGRLPLFGEVVGHSEAAEGSSTAPTMVLTELGRRVEDEWWRIPRYYPQIEIIALQMMPDHLHGILFVKEQMEKDLSRVVRGFKTGCNRAYREVVLGGVTSIVTQSQQTGQQDGQQTGLQAERQAGLQAGTAGLQGERQAGLQAEAEAIQRRKRRSEDRAHGLLFAPGFNDKLLLRQGQLQRWLDYLHDNPRRLLMKREHPDLFRVQRNLLVGTQQFSAIGNRFLLNHPVKIQVQCSRSMTEGQIQAKVEECLRAAQGGAVLVSPSISRGEKAVMRAAFERGFRSSSFRKMASLLLPSQEGSVWMPVHEANFSFWPHGNTTTSNSPSVANNACR